MKLFVSKRLNASETSTICKLKNYKKTVLMFKPFVYWEIGKKVAKQIDGLYTKKCQGKYLIYPRC